MSEDLKHTIVELTALQSGKEKEIEEVFPPSFMEVDENDLEFRDSVHVKGKIYLAGDAIIFQFSAEVSYRLPCKVCNKSVDSVLHAKNIIHAEEIDNLENGRFNYGVALREALLLELPDVIECEGGECPERAHIKKYLKEERKEDGNSEMSYHPFSSL